MDIRLTDHSRRFIIACRINLNYSCGNHDLVLEKSGQVRNMQKELKEIRKIEQQKMRLKPPMNDPPNSFCTFCMQALRLSE